MIITCDNCKTRYKVADDILTKPALKVRCYKCNHRFTVYKNDPSDDSFLLQDEITAADHRIITLSNQKGGVAKTTTCLNLAVALAQMGKKVLVVDFDVQANLTILLGFRKTRSFYELLNKEVKGINDIILHTKYPNLSLLPSNSKMALLKKRYLKQHNFEYLLRNRLQEVEKKYDHILIDTPPSIEFFTLNALIAAQLVIVPTTCEYLSMHGVSQIGDIINVLKGIDHDIEYKVLITMFDKQKTSERVINEKIRRKYGAVLCSTFIEIDDKMQESHIVNLPIQYYDEKSRSAGQYQALARELIE
ncbi:MAG: ParA family protein [Candidatus Electrothrix sp. AW2]|nr:ParA family protein [Candidatus Electrothrix sp. AX1]MCI5116916.1 ParA family protein [Candidatus Electrothrix gigas]MCI5134277.1 ParA family protein [Candidatus Electrothrix gigas]MCI5178030.1 ParA family protein [Candidatus Electrothrix gigas]MCI5181459.1 ParA family protein [Candidatus Electrothrix gigas]